jgi:hypothetical protein
MQQMVAVSPASAQYVGWLAFGLLELHSQVHEAREPAGQNFGELEVRDTSPPGKLRTSRFCRQPPLTGMSFCVRHCVSAPLSPPLEPASIVSQYKSERRV